MFAASVTENPFAILTLIAAPAVFTNASSVLALGTGNRLALVVDRTRVIARELYDAPSEDNRHQLWRDHLDRLERRGSLLVRALRLFYGSIGAFAGASLVSVFGASLATSRYQMPFEAFAAISFVAGAVGFVALVMGCAFLVSETRLALQSVSEEAKLARSLRRSK